MTIAKDNYIANANLHKIEKTNEERAEEKIKYNNFMNFMANIIVKYGLNEKIDESKL